MYALGDCAMANTAKAGVFAERAAGAVADDIVVRDPGTGPPHRSTAPGRATSSSVTGWLRRSKLTSSAVRRRRDVDGASGRSQRRSARSRRTRRATLVRQRAEARATVAAERGADGPVQPTTSHALRRLSSTTWSGRRCRACGSPATTARSSARSPAAPPVRPVPERPDDGPDAEAEADGAERAGRDVRRGSPVRIGRARRLRRGAASSVGSRRLDAGALGRARGTSGDELEAGDERGRGDGERHDGDHDREQRAAHDSPSTELYPLRVSRPRRRPVEGRTVATLPGPWRDISLVSGEFWGRNPHDELAWMRANEPVYWDEAGQIWGIAKYDHVREIELNTVDFSSAGGTRPETGGNPYMIEMDPPAHGKRRGLVSQGFTAAPGPRARSAVRKIVDAVLDRVEGRDTFDLVTDVAAWLPLIVIGDAMGMDPKDHDDLLEWSDDLMRGLGSQDAELLREAGGRLRRLADVHHRRDRRPPREPAGRRHQRARPCRGRRRAAERRWTSSSRRC